MAQSRITRSYLSEETTPKPDGIEIGIRHVNQVEIGHQRHLRGQTQGVFVTNRIAIEDINETAMTQDDADNVTGGASGPPGVARSGGGVPGFSLSGGGVPGTPYLAVELENVQITSYQLG